MTTRRSWREMSPSSHIAVAVLASVEIVLTAVAVVDLARRPRDQIRGGKALWWPIVFIQPVGPVSYLWWGRRRQLNTEKVRP